MSEKELLTKKFILVGMEDAKISTVEKPIIGTHALATCHGVLLYSEETKQAIVAHVPCDEYKAIDTINKIFRLIRENNLLKIKFKYKIFSGYYVEDHYNITELLEKHFTDFIPFDEKYIPENAIQKDESTESCEFAFDASNGKFVSDKVFFGTYYYIINNDESNINDQNIARQR